jgi:uncharacterized protein (TIGR02246 family)
MVLFAWCALVAISSTYAQEDSEQLSPDQQAIKKNAEAFVAAFEKGDAKAVAALWAENGEMSLDGETIAEGRDEVEARYAEYFKEDPGAKIDVHIDSIRVVSPTLAIERGYSEVFNDGDDTAVDAYRLVYTKQDGAWLIASADVQLEVVEPPYDWKADLGFLVGKWRATDGDWSVTTEFEWVPGGNFLKRTFTIKDGEEEIRTGVQVIGWDARERSVTSWTFGTDGGHGRGWWSPEGNQWFVEIEGVSPRGEEMTAHNIITVLDDNTFRWQSTNRSVAGVSLENTEPITVKRVASE